MNTMKRIIKIKEIIKNKRRRIEKEKAKEPLKILYEKINLKKEFLPLEYRVMRCSLPFFHHSILFSQHQIEHPNKKSLIPTNHYSINITQSETFHAAYDE